MPHRRCTPAKQVWPLHYERSFTGWFRRAASSQSERVAEASCSDLRVLTAGRSAEIKRSSLKSHNLPPLPPPPAARNDPSLAAQTAGVPPDARLVRR
jgi:hypothetical protein